MSQPQQKERIKEHLDRERINLLRQVNRAVELPMVILGFVWLVLLVLELARGLNPTLQFLTTAIWVIFILDFLLKFTLAPAKLVFLRKNILTIVSLIVPALRVFRFGSAFRIIRSLRAARGIRLVKVLGSINRGMRSLRHSLGRRGFGYVLALSLVVLFAGAAGMYTLENDYPTGLKSYWEALWFTAMILITIGSDFWPITGAGRILCLLLSVYGFTMFGYFTAVLATFFLGRDAENKSAEIAGAAQLNEIQKQVKELRELLIAQQAAGGKQLE